MSIADKSRQGLATLKRFVEIPGTCDWPSEAMTDCLTDVARYCSFSGINIANALKNALEIMSKDDDYKKIMRPCLKRALMALRKNPEADDARIPRNWMAKGLSYPDDEGTPPPSKVSKKGEIVIRFHMRESGQAFISEALSDVIVCMAALCRAHAAEFAGILVMSLNHSIWEMQHYPAKNALDEAYGIIHADAGRHGRGEAWTMPVQEM